MNRSNIFPYTLYTADKTRCLEGEILASSSLSGLNLMHRAANCALKTLGECWPNTKKLHIFCGGGNNGGDGYTMAALAAKRGLQVTAWQLSENNTEEPYRYALQEGVDVVPFSEEAWHAAVEQDTNLLPTVIVDALLGIGSKGALKGGIKQAVGFINRLAYPVLSVDIPTGINTDTGAFLGADDILCDKQAVRADATISFIVPKIGTFVGDGRNHAGKLFFDDLGAFEEAHSPDKPMHAAAHIIDHKAFLSLLPKRALDSHKGSSGHVLVIGGDIGFGGAPLMAAQMAARAGAGLVGVATQAINVPAIITRQPELMAVGVDNGQVLSPLLNKPTVFVVGPGLGQSAWSEQLLYHALKGLQQGKKVLIDADALNLLALDKLCLPKPQSTLSANWVLTPHPGEAARLLKMTIADIQADRIAAVKALHHKYGGTIVLKGAGTLVLTHDERLFVCNAGNPGMATGGMGDVLSGLIGSLAAQGLAGSDAACLGVVLHAMAGDLAVAESGMRGLLATDLIPYVRMFLKEVQA